MDTRRTLEGEFHTARAGSTPGDATPTLVIGGNGNGTGNITSRKRRLTSTSAASIGDDPTVTIQLGSHARERIAMTSPRPNGQNGLDPVRLLEENERLRFELENAKSLQEVLESNLTGLRDQLVREKLEHGKSAPAPGGEGASQRRQPTDRLSDPSDPSDPSDRRDPGDDADYRAVREDLDNAVEELEEAQDTISRLRLALSTAETSKDALDQQNESLQDALQTAQADAEREAAEKHALQARVAELEAQAELAGAEGVHQVKGDVGAADVASDFETTLEIQMLSNKLSKSQQSLIDTTKSLEDARSKVRRLEQAIESQDAEHVSFVQATEELAGWKTIFKHLDANPTPDVLLRHIRELETKLERTEAQLELASPRRARANASPGGAGASADDAGNDDDKDTDDTDDTARRLASLENNVVSLEQENLQLHHRVKSLNAALEAAEATNAGLAHRLGNGAFNPETTKVLHMKRNPFADTKLAQMQVELDTLRGENQVLKKTGAGPGLGDASAVSAELATTQGKLTATEKKLANSEKSNRRLQEIFSQQIATFRESISLLFGWQLDMTSDPSNKKERARLSLTIKSEAPGGKQKRLAFRMVDDGAAAGVGRTSVVLVETPFSKKHQKTVDTCITAMGSVPLFVANLTLDDIQNRDV